MIKVDKNARFVNCKLYSSCSYCKALTESLTIPLNIIKCSKCGGYCPNFAGMTFINKENKNDI